MDAEIIQTIPVIPVQTGDRMVHDPPDYCPAEDARLPCSDKEHFVDAAHSRWLSGAVPMELSAALTHRASRRYCDLR